MAPKHLDEKGEDDAVPDKKPTRFSFSRKHRQQKTKDDNRNRTGDDVDASVSEEVAPVSLSRLFQYVQVDGQFDMHILIALKLCHSVRVNAKCRRFACCRWRWGSSGMSYYLIVHSVGRNTWQ